MTPSEAAKLVAVVKSYWPHYAPTDDDLKAGIAAFADALSDVGCGEAAAAVRDLGRESGRFAPTPGEVRVRAVRLFGPPCWCGRRGSHVHLPEPRQQKRPALPGPPAVTPEEAAAIQRRMVAALTEATR
jgi:hypothetical protein